MEPDNENTNSPEFTQISPAAVDLSASQATDSKPPPIPSKSVFWLGSLFTALFFIALAVIFILPNYVAEPELEELATQDQSPAPSTSSKIKPSSPWQEAQLARDRKIAQEVLAELLEKQFQLEESGVQQWAPEDYATSISEAEIGDQHYREQLFKEATEAYKKALAVVTTLLDSIEQRLANFSQEGNLALDNGDATKAEQAFNLALLINPDEETAIDGLQRTNVLPEVLALMDEAITLQSSGQLEAAREPLQKALTLDPQSKRSKEFLGSLDQKIEDAKLAMLMSAGYQALAQQRFSTAQSSFNKAITLRPDSKEAKEAYKQATEQRKVQKISASIQQAESLEKKEQWQAALEQYDKALAVDSTLVSVRNGRSETLARAKLDLALQQANSHPERLASSSVHQSAKVLLGKALRISNPGPRLAAQMDELKIHIKDALIPVSVLLQSDNLTDVTVYKVSHLGLFENHNLSLRPGSYVAVGSRDGYRDVRKEFTVKPRSSNIVVQIQCIEKI